MSLPTQELVNRAATAMAEGRLAEAQNFAQKAVDTSPDNAEALLVLGMIADKNKRPDVALPLLLRAAELDSTCYQSRLLISTVLQAQGQTDEALAWAEQAVAINGDEPRGQNQLGLCLLGLHEWDQAGRCLTRAIELDPKVPILYSNLGQALLGAGRNGEAIQAFSHSLSLNPRQINVLGRLAAVLLAESNNEGAEACARKMMEIDPFSASANILLASALIAEGQSEEASKFAHRAAKFAPADAEIIARFGTILQMLGQTEEATVQFRKSIELNPRQGNAYRGLTHNQKITETDRPLVEQMSLIAESQTYVSIQASDLQYAIGKAREDLGEYEAAMVHFDEANRLVRQKNQLNAPFFREQLIEQYEAPIVNMNAEFIENNQNSGSDSALPIFVVGMIRSGTTLVEQILSSHPVIGAAGEQQFWANNYASAFSTPGQILDLDTLASLSAEYCKRLQTLCPGSQRVVDKMPGNFNYLGLLQCAFPNAHFVHVIRNPVDTCLSIWKTPNKAVIEWANDKDNIVLAYRLYQRLADHWRKVLPADRYLEIRYEDLIANQEAVTREMIAFCGVEWDEACLHPEDNKRAVTTPSVWQVRQPLYKSSTEKWRCYELWLGAFAELIEPAEN